MHPLPTLQRIRWQHRFYGYLEPALALPAAQDLLHDVGPDAGGTQAETVSLACGLLRQALTLAPYDHALAELCRRLGASRPPSPGFAAWDATLVKVLAQCPALSPDQALATVDAVEGDPAALAGLRGTAPWPLWLRAVP